MITYRRMTWFALHFGEWCARGVQELTYNEMTLSRASHRGES